MGSTLLYQGSVRMWFHICAPDPAEFSSIPDVVLCLINTPLVTIWIYRENKVQHETTNIGRERAQFEETHVL